MQKVCSVRCSISYAQKQSEKKKAAADKAERKATREAKQRVKKIGEWAAEAQTAFNAWIRERDREAGCISCGTRKPVQYCAGHYLTVGAHPELRFEPLNVHKQCNKNCNLSKSGNVIKYRQRLIKKIGLEKVEWLEGPHEPKRYRVEDYKAIKAMYTKLKRELEKSRMELSKIDLIGLNADEREETQSLLASGTAGPKNDIPDDRGCDDLQRGAGCGALNLAGG